MKVESASGSRAQIPFRVGNGYDIHRLIPGGPLSLGGVKIDFDKGLEGHSDGDSATHAVIDALLGAAGLGDIGMHFPPGDPRFKGADSKALLAAVKTMLEETGWQVGNVDVTIICEQPKLSPHYPSMRGAIAAALGVPEQLISIKATTNERIGTIGAGEAIAAHAVALLVANPE